MDKTFISEHFWKATEFWGVWIEPLVHNGDAGKRRRFQPLPAASWEDILLKSKAALKVWVFLELWVEAEGAPKTAANVVRP